MTDTPIVWTKDFKKKLKKMDKSIKKEIIKKIEKIAKNPGGGKPLSNVLKNFREEYVGKYRVIYNFSNNQVTLIYIHDKEDGSRNKSLLGAVKNFKAHFFGTIFVIINNINLSTYSIRFNTRHIFPHFYHDYSKFSFLFSVIVLSAR